MENFLPSNLDWYSLFILELIFESNPRNQFGISMISAFSRAFKNLSSKSAIFESAFSKNGVERNNNLGQEIKEIHCS